MRSKHGVVGLGLVLGIAATLWGAPAAARPVCAGAGQDPIAVGSVAGAALEGVTVDPTGRLYTADNISGRIYRIDAPGARAVTVAAVPAGNAATALAWSPDGTLLVGYADTRMLVGDLAHPGSIGRVDLSTGTVTTIASGLSAVTGLAVARDGTMYATNEFGAQVGRVLPDGSVQADWANLPSASGAAIGGDGRYLYVSRVLANPGVTRIPIAAPQAPESLITFAGADVISAPTRVTLDSKDRPIVAASATGQILRIDGDSRTCALAQGITASSALTYGRGDAGFSAGRLFRAGFDGQIYEIPGGFDANARTAIP
ncbi:SMP-30/gluconolactonase/LRE family protein [Antrihabitans cavernicola]|uniref:SMP-30/Gluconolactonase/LRE-like region domain-containing protein n=1 Tax=Antrihabitans cavernicola TaxID=2495913 RepID=A0A5A7SDJ9_9NOCA|nr:SMP-30/gluconolactonase/LRE family protein [Spelaeibacter cavernicola]KAA0023262.1 hypothetical protein FOY51_07480 [Spelaeibacter cavernicola]